MMEKEQRQKTKEEIEADLRDERTIEQLLSDVGAGWGVSLNRIRPSWCKGWLETIDASPDEKLDMDYIADTWGGETIRLRLLDTKGKYKGGKDFHVARPPMSHGIPLEHPEEKRARLAREERSRERREENIRLNASQPAPDNSMMNIVVDVLKGQNENNTKIYQDMAKMQNRDPMGIDDILKVADGLKKLEGVFGGGGGSADENDGMLGAFMEIMKNANDRDKEKLALRVDALKKREAALDKRPRQLQGRKAPPQGAPGPAGRQGNPTPTTPVPPIVEVQKAAPDESEELALSEELAELSAAEAAEVLGEAFTMMPIEKRQKTIKLFLAFGNAANAIDLAGDDADDQVEDVDDQVEDVDDVEDVEDVDDQAFASRASMK